jgi:hypothetical protein
MKTKTTSILFTSLLAACLSVGTAWTAHAQSPTPTPSDLFVSLNGPVFGFGGASIYEYTPQYIYIPGLAVPPSGSPPSNIVASTLYAPRGLVFDNAGNLFVASNNLDSSGNNYQATILKITPDGLMSTFASGFPTNFFLEGLVFDNAGNLFVMAGNNNDPKVPSTIYKVTSDGAVSPFGLQSDCVQQGTNVNCSTPGLSLGLAFDSAGNIYAADLLDSTIYKFPSGSVPPGSVRTIFAGPAAFPPSPVDFTQTEGPCGLAFDSSGNLFVSTKDIPGNGVILEFASNGTVTTSFTGMPTNAGAQGLTFDAAGNLFVAEAGWNGQGSGAIQEFPSVGSSPAPSPAPTPITFASGYGSQTNRGPEFLAFAPANTAVASTVTTAVALTFPTATAPLTTSVTLDPTAPTPPPNFELTGDLTFDITTTTTPTPPIILAFTVPSSDYDPTTLKVMHYECPPNPAADGISCGYVDRTIYPTASAYALTGPGDPGYPSNPAPYTIYGSVNSLSPVIIAKFKFKAQVQPPIKANGTSVFKRGVVVAVKFTLTSDGVATCQLPPATISLISTAGTILSGKNFRIDSTNCKYVYNLATRSLSTGTYQVNILIGGSVAGTGTFTLK